MLKYGGHGRRDLGWGSASRRWSRAFEALRAGAHIHHQVFSDPCITLWAKRAQHKTAGFDLRGADARRNLSDGGLLSWR